MIGKAAGFNYISVEYLLWLRSLRELRPPIEGLSACVLGGGGGRVGKGFELCCTYISKG